MYTCRDWRAGLVILGTGGAQLSGMKCDGMECESQNLFEARFYCSLAKLLWESQSQKALVLSSVKTFQ